MRSSVRQIPAEFLTDSYTRGSGYSHPWASYSLCLQQQKSNQNNAVPLNSPGANLKSRYMAGLQGKIQDVFCNHLAPAGFPRTSLCQRVVSMRDLRTRLNQASCLIAAIKVLYSARCKG